MEQAAGLAPDFGEMLQRARADLRAGVAVGLRSGDNVLVFIAVETLRKQRLAGLRALGDPVIAVTRRRAETLKARTYDGDLARLRLPAEASCDWVNALADPAQDLNAPMKGPLEALRGGDAGLFRIAIALVKSARLLPAAIGVEAAGAGLDGLTVLDGAGTARALAAQTALKRVVTARVPLHHAREARLHVFRPADGGEEHYAVEIGRPDRDAPVLTRLHSACFTGDLLGSLKCDCGAQLQSALTAIGAEGAGVLLYLNQEGRGIGLANKMRAYSLQDQGFDTVEANHRLGFEDDERDFRLGASILHEMGFSRARLMTNNPAKVAMLVANGIEVTERIALKVGHTDENRQYLETKATKSGHLL